MGIDSWMKLSFLFVCRHILAELLWWGGPLPTQLGSNLLSGFYLAILYAYFDFHI